jgi:hypothetical protein
VNKLLTALAPVRKLAGSVLGGATGVGVAEALNAVGWHLPTAIDGALAVLLAAVGTWLAPANSKPAASAPPVPPAAG